MCPHHSLLGLLIQGQQMEATPNREDTAGLYIFPLDGLHHLCRPRNFPRSTEVPAGRTMERVNTGALQRAGALGRGVHLLDS